MKIGWAFEAQTMFDQLSAADQTSVLAELARLEDAIWPDAPLPEELTPLGQRGPDQIYSFLPLPDWRLKISRHQQKFTVIDVARPDQLEFIKSLYERHHALHE